MWQSWQGEEVVTAVSSSFCFGIILSDNRRLQFAPCRLIKCHDSLDVFRHQDWQLLGAVKQKTHKGRVALLVLSCVQDPAQEETERAVGLWRANVLKCSKETAKKSIKATLLMWISFLKRRKLVNRGVEGVRVRGWQEAWRPFKDGMWAVQSKGFATYQNHSYSIFKGTAVQLNSGVIDAFRSEGKLWPLNCSILKSLTVVG